MPSDNMLEAIASYQETLPVAPPKPSNMERAELPEASKEYMEFLEGELERLTSNQEIFSFIDHVRNELGGATAFGRAGIQLWAASFVDFFQSCPAENFVTTEVLFDPPFDSDQQPMRIAVTVGKVGAESPAEQLAKLRKENEELKQKIKELENDASG